MSLRSSNCRCLAVYEQDTQDIDARKCLNDDVCVAAFCRKQFQRSFEERLQWRRKHGIIECCLRSSRPANQSLDIFDTLKCINMASIWFQSAFKCTGDMIWITLFLLCFQPVRAYLCIKDALFMCVSTRNTTQMPFHHPSLHLSSSWQWSCHWSYICIIVSYWSVHICMTYPAQHCNCHPLPSQYDSKIFIGELISWLVSAVNLWVCYKLHFARGILASWEMLFLRMLWRAFYWLEIGPFPVIIITIVALNISTPL